MHESRLKGQPSIQHMPSSRVQNQGPKPLNRQHLPDHFVSTRIAPKISPSEFRSSKPRASSCKCHGLLHQPSTPSPLLSSRVVASWGLYDPALRLGYSAPTPQPKDLLLSRKSSSTIVALIITYTILVVLAGGLPHHCQWHHDRLPDAPGIRRLGRSAEGWSTGSLEESMHPYIGGEGAYHILISCYFYYSIKPGQICITHETHNVKVIYHDSHSLRSLKYHRAMPISRVESRPCSSAVVTQLGLPWFKVFFGCLARLGARKPAAENIGSRLQPSTFSGDYNHDISRVYITVLVSVDRPSFEYW